MDGSVLLSKHGSIQVSVKDLSARINTLFVYLPTHQPPYRHQTDRDRPPRQHFIPCHYASEFRAEGNKRTVYGQRRKKGATDNLCNPLNLLARLERFELPTYGFVVRCSIQLSYKRIMTATCIALDEIYQLLFDASFCHGFNKNS